jgi:hypothetical protein
MNWLFLAVSSLSLMLLPTSARNLGSIKTTAVPDVIWYANRHDQAEWVAARAAFDKNGALRSDYFAPEQRSFLAASALKNSDGNCNVNFTQPPSHAEDRTYNDVVANSRVVVSGDVVDSAIGFFKGYPATLVALRVDQRLRSSGSVKNGDIIFITLPSAKIKTAAGSLCTKALSEQIETLAPGDHVLVFAFNEPTDATHTVFSVSAARHLLVQRSGTDELSPNSLAKEIGISSSVRAIAAGIQKGEVK